MSRYIGISLDDDYTNVCINDETVTKPLPTVIAKHKKDDRWTVGEEAYKETLAGYGVIVDKLVSLLEKNGTATIARVKYTAIDIVYHYFQELLRTEEDPSEEDRSGDIVVVTIRKASRTMVEKLQEAILRTGVREENLHIISHTESFAHFVLHQDSSLYNRKVGMFELNNQCLCYYEMHVSRGTRRFALLGSEAETEAFNIDILKTTSGGKIADRILTTVAERTLGKDAYSAVFLCGRGFRNTNFATNFMNFICNRRRVLIEPGLFCIGAEIHARNIDEGKSEEYTILCDTRVSADISARVVINEKEENLPIVKAGTNWMDSRTSYELIEDDQDYIDFQVTSLAHPRRPIRLRMMLDRFPKRENRTTRIRMSTEFVDAETLRVTVRDLGFGDLFPSSGQEITEEIDLADKV